MKTEELFELVVVLTAKNMALEEDLKAIEESYHKVVKKLHDERIEEMQLEDEDDEHDYYASMEEEEEDNVLDEIIMQDYKANCIHEKDVELEQRLRDISDRLIELTYRITELEEEEDNNGK